MLYLPHAKVKCQGKYLVSGNEFWVVLGLLLPTAPVSAKVAVPQWRCRPMSAIAFTGKPIASDGSG